MSVASTQRTVLFVGDQTDPWVDGIDYITRQAGHTPWLKSFMADLCRTIQAELRDMEPAVTDSLGNFSSLQDLAETYRHCVDETGVANAILIHAVRAAMLLQCIKREPHLLKRQDSPPEWLGISGGILSLSALAVAHDFESLYDACLWVGGLICRLCRFCYIRSRATEDCPGTWGWAVLGISTEQLKSELEQFQSDMGIPSVKRAQVGIYGDRWSTIIGPPSVLTQFFNECPAVSGLPRNELNIHSLQHSLQTSPTDLDYIVGDSAICSTLVCEECRMWGMDEPQAMPGSTFGEFARNVVSQALSRPLDVVKVIGDLKRRLESSTDIHVKVMGPSSHTSYLTSILRERSRRVTVQQEISVEPRARNNQPSGRIAIIGMSGRGPGSDDLDEFWNIIKTGQDLHQEIPKDRFDMGEFCAASNEPKDQSDKCTTSSRYGCFMDRPGGFDARFFRISPREAFFMDPGHRQFLMSACEALETAGYSDAATSNVDSGKIGVFFGQSNDDWHIMAHEMKGCDAYTLQGSQRAFGAGRLAFHMNWEGPTYSLDSACASASSSLHLACMSLNSHDVDMAVTGAANVIGYPHTWSCLSKAGILSKTGNCKAFRDDADGYCRADFVGSVVLKRLEDAMNDNDNILAVIAGSGRNHSGKSTSITTSDAAAQEQLFRKVLQRAAVLPDEISYVEMHGTGTQIGDPAEMGAVTNVFRHRQAAGPLAVGSIKANIGHSEAAAGMSSLIKSILMFEKNTIPPQAGMPHTLNPKFEVMHKHGVTIPVAPQDFNPQGDEPRRILLNNFDAAGGNACLLLEDYRGQDDRRRVQLPWSKYIVATSAKSLSSLTAYKRKLLKWLYKNPDAKIEDLSYSTTARRLHHPIRSAYVATTPQELTTKLRADLDSDQPLPKTAGAITKQLVLVFTGQGAHYAGMGSEMYRTSRVFREAVNHCVEICAGYKFPPFLDIITEHALDISAKEPVQIQLAVLSLEIALAAIWTSDAGLTPSVVLGHSLGEYAALHVAGVLSLTDVLYLVGHRGLLMAKLCEAGSCALMAVSAPAQAVQDILDDQKDSSCSIACMNSPRATVIGGTVDDIERLKGSMVGIRTKLLPVPFAFHSCQMDSLTEDYVALARSVSYAAPKIPVASTLSAQIVDSSGIFNAEYIGEQTRNPVRFSDAINAVNTRLNNPAWLEVGPTQVCGSFVHATVSPSPPADSGSIMSTLESGVSNWESFSKCLVRLYENGIDIDWPRLFIPWSRELRLLRLPTYAWDLQDFWITYTEPDKIGSRSTNLNFPTSPRIISTCAQTVMDEKSSLDHKEVTLRASTSETGFNAIIEGHRIRDVAVCPGSVFVDAAVAAASYLLESDGHGNSCMKKALTVRNLALHRPLTRNTTNSTLEGELLTTASMTKLSKSQMSVSFRFSGYSLGDCQVVLCDANETQAGWNKMSRFIESRMNEIMRSATEHGHRMQPGIFYALFSNTVQYHSSFKCVKEAYITNDFSEAAARIVLQPDPSGTHFASSPYFGESLVHLAGFVLNANPDRPRARETTFMMDRLESIEQPDATAVKAGELYMSYVHVSTRTEDMAKCDVYIFNEHSRKLVMQCSGLQFHEVTSSSLDRLLGKPTNSVKPPGRLSNGPNPKETHLHADSSATLFKDEQKTSFDEPPQKGPSPTNEVHLDVFDIILKSISAETATEISELRDDTNVADLGVDSIMAIEIASEVRKSSGTDIPASFMIDYPTIGDLRQAFGAVSSRPDSPSADSIQLSSGDGPQFPGSSESSHWGTVSSTPNSEPKTCEAGEGAPNETALDTAQVAKALEQKPPRPDLPMPSARITMLHGRPASGQTPLYLLADGTGSIATYLHLAPFKSNLPVYGIDSPFVRCPERLDPSTGVPEIARLIVEALVAARPDGSFYIGGFSGGGMLSYEVCLQLADAGRQVDGLLMIDMCCPRDKIDSKLVKVQPEPGWSMFQKMAARDMFWSLTASSTPMQHLLAFFESVAAYHPSPMTPRQRPRKAAIIWAAKGLVSRCAGDPDMMQELADQGFPTEPYAGFMEDSTLGAIAWGVPDKRGVEDALGPNGWDKYIQTEISCQAVDADHMEMLTPGHVYELHGAMEKVLAGFQETG